MKYNNLRRGAFLIIAVCLIFEPIAALAQGSTVRRPDAREIFANAKTGKPFALSSPYPRLNGADSFDFGHLKGPAFISLGFYSCGPCRAAMPHFIALARARPQNSFVYITYDAKSVIEDELRGNKESLDSLPGNLSIIRMSGDKQYYHSLVMGYPVKYFIHSDGIVAAVTLGGPVNHMDKEASLWAAALDKLH